MDQDLVLELLQLPSRVEAELVGQPVPGPLVRRQRIGLAAVAVQGDHQQRPQALAQRMLADEPFELADHLARGAEVEPRRELILDETETDLLEAGTVRDDPVAITGGGEDLAVEHATAPSCTSPAQRTGRRRFETLTACSARRSTSSASTALGSTSSV